jgi:hypothetical protein
MFQANHGKHIVDLGFPRLMQTMHYKTILLRLIQSFFRMEQKLEVLVMKKEEMVEMV